MATDAPCPQCGKQIEWSTDNSHRPFCSERCKLIDLGAWASGQYRIPTEDKAREDPEEGKD